MFDFPNSPTVNQQVTAANGIVYQWDGVKWNSLAGGSAIAIGSVPPSSPVTGQLWWDNIGGQLYIYYNDGNSSQWVPATGIPTSNLSPILVSPPSAASWTQRNFNAGVTTLTDVANGVALYTSCATGTVTNVLRAATIAVPAAPYVIDMNLAGTALLAGSANYVKMGALWSDGTKAQVLSIVDIAVAANFDVETYSALSTYAALVATFYARFNPQSLWMRLADNGTNVTFSVGPDGVSWLPVYTIAKASGYLGAGGYSNVGFFINEQVMGNGGLGTITLQSWRVH